MGETQAEFMLRDEIATEIVHISRRLMQRTARAMESLNVGFGQAAILKVLSDHGEMAQRRLAEEIRVTPATVCGTLKRMERAGLITRCKHAQDKRNIDVTLTPRGEAAALQAIRSRQQYADEMLGGLSDLRKRQLLAIMDELLAEWGASANPREYEYYGKEEDSDGCK